MKTLIITILVTLVFVSCRKDETPVLNGNDKLVGSWINPLYNDTLVTYTKADNLLENEPGFTFKSGNTLICRQNSGWCGTPPITTADYEGTWNWKDSMVDIATTYWGGSASFSWKVISLDNSKLVVWVAKSEYHEGK